MFSDVSERIQLERLFRFESNIDLVVHCAGTVNNGLLKDLNAKNFEQLFTAKVTGVIADFVDSNI
jgi:short-subunit dehydrogenase